MKMITDYMLQNSVTEPELFLMVHVWVHCFFRVLISTLQEANTKALLHFKLMICLSQDMAQPEMCGM